MTSMIIYLVSLGPELRPFALLRMLGIEQD